MAGTETAAAPPTLRKSLRFSVVDRSFEFSLMLSSLCHGGALLTTSAAAKPVSAIEGYYSKL
jgi:hypothetical protein